MDDWKKDSVQALEALPMELRVAAAMPSGPLPLEMQAGVEASSVAGFKG